MVIKIFQTNLNLVWNLRLAKSIFFFPNQTGIGLENCTQFLGVTFPNQTGFGLEKDTEWNLAAGPCPCFRTLQLETWRKKFFCHRVYLRQVSDKTISSYQSFTTFTNIYRSSDHDTIIRIDYTRPKFSAPPMAGPSHQSSIATKYRRICHQNWPGLNFWSDGENSVQEN